MGGALPARRARALGLSPIAAVRRPGKPGAVAVPAFYS